MITALAQLRLNAASAGAPPSPHLLGMLNEREARLLKEIRTCHHSVTVYSQSPQAALERLEGSLRHGG
jgi:hypothetical protein